MKTSSIFGIVVWGCLCCFTTAFAAEIPMASKDHKASKPKENILSRFVVMDFEGDVLKDRAWMAAQPSGFSDFMVVPVGGDGGIDELSLGIGEGRNGGNALVVTSTSEASRLPGVWIFKARADGERIQTEQGYMLPRDKRANRLSFWLKFDRGYRESSSMAQPPTWPNANNFEVGTYQFNPEYIGTNEYSGVVESNNWHFYHQLFIRHDKAQDEWIHVVLNQSPQHQRSVNDMIPNNPTQPYGDYWSLLTRLYVESIGYGDTPEIEYPFRMLVDDVELLYVEESEGISVEFNNLLIGTRQDAVLSVEKSFDVTLRNNSSKRICGNLVVATPRWMHGRLMSGAGVDISGEGICFDGDEIKSYKVSVTPESGPQNPIHLGLLFTDSTQIHSDSFSRSVSLSTPYLERRRIPESGPNDAVVSGSHILINVQ